MISLHDPEDNPAKMASGWYYPWGQDPGEWALGQTAAWAFSLRACADAVCAFPWSPSRYEDGRRHESSFLCAQVVALDFDEGWTLNEAIEMFSPFKHIIATTRNHQKQKGKKPPCDRFRVLLFLASPCTDLVLYKSILAGYVEEYQADEQVKDGARLFFPCREIVSIGEGYSAPILQKKEAPAKAPPTVRNGNINHPTTPRPGGHSQSGHRDPTTKAGCRAWLGGAGLQEGIRNRSCYRAAGDLFESGWSQGQVVDWLLSVGTTLPMSEIMTTVNSAMRKKKGC